MAGPGRKKKIMQLAKGMQGRTKNCFRLAINRVEKGLQNACEWLWCQTAGLR